MPGQLFSGFKALPPPADQAAVARAMGDLAERAPALHGRLGTDPKAANLLAAAFGGSPYLRELMLNEPGWVEAALDGDPAVICEELCQGLARSARTASSGEEMMRDLRRARSQASLVIALADLASRFDIGEATAALTRFADAAVAAAVDYLLLDAARSGKLATLDPERPAVGSGYVILAMGKHGAFELNYSSDVDLIALYDAQSSVLAEGTEPSKAFVRITRDLVRLLQDLTDDGYAFRVDLRLRPDPRATQIAIAIEAAAIYYENMGQNWERAAMIKARPCAGDLSLGAEFLDRLVPYVWRKYLDYAAIADVQSLKRQIHAVKGHGEVAVRGHNVKLGRGGIREIEFFVQTQQLIAGGRNPTLRGRRTLEMLDALAAAGWIEPATAADMKRHYAFLRHVEHRIQMVADEQTHDLPRDEAAFERLARFAGYAASQDFKAALRSTFESVQKHYSRLFEKATALGGEGGSLVFTGGEDDPDTIDTLTRMGFRQASEVSATIRGWHFGRYPATRSGRAKEILTEIMPTLLNALASTGDADNAFLAFDRFLSRLSSGVQIFSMLKANPDLLDLLARLLGMAPRLAEELSLRPRILDAVLDSGPAGSLPTRDDLLALTSDMGRQGTFEAALDGARTVGREQMFRVGVGLLSGTTDASEAGRAFSDIADVMIGRLLDATRRDLRDRHGVVEGERIAVIALGKLGGREMTAASDLDLMVIYDTAPGAEASGGSKPLSVMQYFTRVTQRLIAALSSPTAEGILYEVDMRLRPSGNKGPVATHISSFEAYHEGSAWTWEKLALTRARIVAGDDAFRGRVEGAIAKALSHPRDVEMTRTDVLDMRRRIHQEIGGKGVWDLKHQRGGLVDIEFIVQFLEIVHAADDPTLLQQNTSEALAALREAGRLSAPDFEVLRDACRLYQRLTQILRLCVGRNFSTATIAPSLGTLLAAGAETPDLATAEALLADRQAETLAVFDRLVGQL